MGIAHRLTVLKLRAASTPAARKYLFAARFEVMALLAAEKIQFVGAPVDRRQAFATGLPGNLAQLRQFGQGVAGLAAGRECDREAADLGAGAGRFMPLRATKAIGSIPAQPAGFQQDESNAGECFSQPVKVCFLGGISVHSLAGGVSGKWRQTLRYHGAGIEFELLKSRHLRIGFKVFGFAR